MDIKIEINQCDDQTRLETVQNGSKDLVENLITQLIKPLISPLTPQIGQQHFYTQTDKYSQVSNENNHHTNLNELLSIDRISRSSLSLDNVHIYGIGTSNPDIIVYTDKAFEKRKIEYEELKINEIDLAKVTSFYENCGIEKRYCHTDLSQRHSKDVFEEEYFNEKYKRIAPILAYKSSLKAIEEWGGDVKNLTHIVSCSCTGVLIPDINFLLIKQLGLKHTIERLSINMMGCFGGLSTIKAARALALQNTKNRVLMICTEISSIHCKLSRALDEMLASAIFADGSAAMVIGCQPTQNEKALYEIIQTGCEHIPDTMELMSWDLTRDGWTLGLSYLIPKVIGNSSFNIVENFLKESIPFSMTLNDCDWLIHPGGKRILLELEKALKIPRERNISAWNILKDYGNMSSATILFVMDDARKRPAKHDYSMALAFGPGLSVEMALLRQL